MTITDPARRAAQDYNAAAATLTAVREAQQAHQAARAARDRSEHLRDGVCRLLAQLTAQPRLDEHGQIADRGPNTALLTPAGPDAPGRVRLDPDALVTYLRQVLAGGTTAWTVLEDLHAAACAARLNDAHQAAQHLYEQAHDAAGAAATHPATPGRAPRAAALRADPPAVPRSTALAPRPPDEPFGPSNLSLVDGPGAHTVILPVIPAQDPAAPPPFAPAASIAGRAAHAPRAGDNDR